MDVVILNAMLALFIILIYIIRCESPEHAEDDKKYSKANKKNDKKSFIKNLLKKKDNENKKSEWKINDIKLGMINYSEV